MKKRGFTLIELLVSLAIISILVVTLSLIFTSSTNINKEAYNEELIYKQNNQAMLYIENLVRKAYKVELKESDSKNCNFTLFVNDKHKENNDQNEYEISTYTFKLVRSTKEKKTYLCSVVDNKITGSRSGTFRIAKIEDFTFYYNPSNQTIKLILNPSNPTTRYESLIYVGDKL